MINKPIPSQERNLSIGVVSKHYDGHKEYHTTVNRANTTSELYPYRNKYH